MFCTFDFGPDFVCEKEILHVRGELSVVLEQEPMRRVGVDLELRTRNQSRQQVREVRQDHGVAVAIGDEHAVLDGAESLQQRVVRYAPGTHRVVLGLPDAETAS